MLEKHWLPTEKDQCDLSTGLSLMFSVTGLSGRCSFIRQYPPTYTFDEFDSFLHLEKPADFAAVLS